LHSDNECTLILVLSHPVVSANSQTDAIAPSGQRDPWTVSTSISSESQLSKNQFSRNAVVNCLQGNKSREERNILGSLQRATDPETGAKLSLNDLVTNSNTLL
jgi:hypothetical protein